jgi:UDP-N-acetylmuramate--alanine ligase
MGLKAYKNIYMVGIKGVGMAMLAQFLKAKNFSITGSDVSDKFPTDKTLIASKIKVHQGFSLKNISDDFDLVIYSSAFSFEKNIELKYFREKNIPILSYAEALGLLFDDYFGVSVCGSHGKTTVTSWLGYVLKLAGEKPNVLTGSYVKQFKGSALIGKSKYLVVESDEYQNKLRYFNPRAVVLNNIEFDHPDYFSDEKKYFKVFSDFIKKIPQDGFLIVNMEDELAMKAASKSSARVISYYIDRPVNKNVDFCDQVYYIKNLKVNKSGQSFSLFLEDKEVGKFKINLPGRHNILNSLAVILTSLELGLSVEEIGRGLKSFLGAARRFEFLGLHNDAIVMDDYAHHPSEVKASLDAVRQKYPNKNIITIFHPHTFSRTRALLEDFSKSFALSDELYLIEIYPSAREKKDKISSLDLIDKIKKYNLSISKEQKIGYFKNLKEAERKLYHAVGPGDVVLLLGAGDVFRIGYNWLDIK